MLNYLRDISWLNFIVAMTMMCTIAGPGLVKAIVQSEHTPAGFAGSLILTLVFFVGVKIFYSGLEKLCGR